MSKSGSALKVLIGYATTRHGILEASPEGILVRPAEERYRGPLSLLVQRMRQPGQSDEELLLSLPERLRGYLWARVLTRPTSNENE